MGNNKDIYVVYGTDFVKAYGHKYFTNEEQAKDYKDFLEKIKQYDFEKYHMDKVIIENENIDYKNANLLSTITFRFDNHATKSLSLEEDKGKRRIKYIPDVEGMDNFTKTKFRIVVGFYSKTQISVAYRFLIKDESEIEKLLEKLNVLNEKIIKEASILINSEFKNSSRFASDSQNDFILSEKLDGLFKDEVNKIISG